MAGIYTFSYPIEKVGDSPYPNPYPINAGIPRQNGDGFEQYPREQIYLPSLISEGIFKFRNIFLNIYSEIYVLYISEGTMI